VNKTFSRLLGLSVGVLMTLCISTTIVTSLKDRPNSLFLLILFFVLYDKIVPFFEVKRSNDD
jgi:hypothetical protein